jgi:sRNA-binding protein
MYNRSGRYDLDRGVDALCEAYPKAFFVNGRHRTPLKHNIAGDIKADVSSDSSSELRYYDIDEVVDWYCSHVGYLRACSVPGTTRVDLKGDRAGTVTESEARVEGERAAAAFEQIESRKRFFAPTVVTAAPVISKPAITSLKVDCNMNDDELLVSIEKHVTSLKTVLIGEAIDQSLRKDLARPVLLLLIDELKTLDARLSA